MVVFLLEQGFEGRMKGQGREKHGKTMEHHMFVIVCG
jgi:hypothetical protein